VVVLTVRADYAADKAASALEVTVPFPRAVQRVSCEPEREPKPAGSQVPRRAPRLRVLPAPARAGLRVAAGALARGSGPLRSTLRPCSATKPPDPAESATRVRQSDVCGAVPRGSRAVTPRNGHLPGAKTSSASIERSWAPPHESVPVQGAGTFRGVR